MLALAGGARDKSELEVGIDCLATFQTVQALESPVADINACINA